jgi:D-alanyl-D-alanine carboxypeptidase
MRLRLSVLMLTASVTFSWSGVRPIAVAIPPPIKSVQAAARLPVTGLPAAAQLYELARSSAPPPPPIKARSAILVDLDTEQVLFELNPHAPRPPASLTKVMTVLVALDHLSLDEEVVVPNAINQLPWDSTRMGLTAGERVKVSDLLYGIFLASGNDAAVTLAEDSGGMDAFMAEMNAKAAKLGMTDSHFVNPVGLDDRGHVMSAADLAIASEYLIHKYPQVTAMASVFHLDIPAGPGHKAYHLWNYNQLLQRYPGTTGLKTGWTGQAGGCLIATVSREGHHLLVVVMGSPRVFDEAKALLDYGFASEF